MEPPALLWGHALPYSELINGMEITQGSYRALEDYGLQGRFPYLAMDWQLLAAMSRSQSCGMCLSPQVLPAGMLMGSVLGSVLTLLCLPAVPSR